MHEYIESMFGARCVSCMLRLCVARDACYACSINVWCTTSVMRVE